MSDLTFTQAQLNEQVWGRPLMLWHSITKSKTNSTYTATAITLAAVTLFFSPSTANTGLTYEPYPGRQ